MIPFRLRLLTLLQVLICGAFICHGQTPVGGSNSMNLFHQADSLNKADSTSNNKGWEDVNAKIYFTTLSSDLHRKPDTSIDHFQDFHPVYPWWGADLGNYGTAVRWLLFQPDNRLPGLSSGYHVYDFYQSNLDSLHFYNTTNPYSAFSFLLGSKDRQMVDLLHTQNITPYWNFAANIKANSATGFFSGQTAKSIAGSMNTNYISKNQRYKLKAALVYNRFSQDENGGISGDSFLTNSNFKDRSRIPTNFPTLFQGRDKSAVNNILSDFDLFAQNNYSWGRSDTTYNKDSTKRTVAFIPRFRLQYDFQLHVEKHQYNDDLPDSARYASILPLTFGVNDTLNGRQKWTFVSNKFSLNGFIGNKEHLMHLQAGIGNRMDHFETLSPNGYLKDNSFNSFLFGSIQKEAVTPEQWHYDANAQLYFTGEALGDFSLNANFGKSLNDWVGFGLTFKQILTSAPESYELFASNFFSFKESFNKISTTQLGAYLIIPKLKVNVSGNYYLLTNYLYYNESIKPLQESTPFSILQVTGSKPVTLGKLFWNNLLAWQQATASAPIHLPAFMAQEQLAFKGDLFHHALHVVTGLSLSYATNYYCDGYSPYLNQFYVQNSYKTNNLPNVGIFFNFSLHHFRAFASLSELQQLISRNNINAPDYPAENMLFQFGFKWILIN